MRVLHDPKLTYLSQSTQEPAGITELMRRAQGTLLNPTHRKAQGLDSLQVFVEA